LMGGRYISARSLWKGRLAAPSVVGSMNVYISGYTIG
jgi:hypothetical protein